MTTTLAHLATGNASVAFVFEMDGYPHLISNAQQSKVQTAWAGTDFASKSVISGLTFVLENQQHLDPWDPMKGGGTLIVDVQPDDDDTLGIDMNRTDNGAETFLEETANRTASIAGSFLDGFAFSGDAYIGTETFDYRILSGKNFENPGLTFGSNRGKYVAFGVKDSTTTYGAVRFAEHHRVSTDERGIRSAPFITEQPRSWVGRRCSLWMHTLDKATGTLNTKADALCVFVGRVTEPRQDPKTGHTKILCEHLLDEIPRTVIGGDAWQATVSYGMRLAAGQTFQFYDINDTTASTVRTLTVVASGASAYNEVDAGQYTHEEISSILNEWLGGERALGNIQGNYTFVSPIDIGGVPRSEWRYFMSGATTTQMKARIRWPTPSWAKPLGFNTQYFWIDDTCGAAHSTPSPGPVQPLGLDATLGPGFLFAIGFDDQTGTFVGQNRTLPAAAKALIAAENPQPDYGIFMLECETPLMLLGSVNGNTLERVRVLTTGFDFSGDGFDALLEVKVPLGSPQPRLRQVPVHEGAIKDLLKWIFLSTGTPAYNDPDFDILPFGHGVGLPYDLLGSLFKLSCDLMPGAEDTATVILDKPRKLIDILKADLVIRNAHLVFREGTFRFVSWTSPSAALATTTLDQTNKAEPIGTKDEAKHRPGVVLDSSFVRNDVKINFNRDAGKAVSGGEEVYLATPLRLIDATSIDDMGNTAKTATIDLRNTYNDTDQIGQGVRALSAGFVSWWSFWSRPLRRMTRSIALTLYETFGVGDVTLNTDPDIRTPTTGRKPLTQYPGLVVRHRYTIELAGQPAKLQMSGECDVIMLAQDRTFAYVPCAELDETKNDGGFTAGYDGNVTLQFKPHEHSESTETVDIGAFANGNKCKLIEVDPDDPATVDSWDVTLASAPNTGTNRVTISAALSSPSFDTNKRYRLVFDSYADTQASQRTKSFQAGENKTIQQTIPPNVYGGGYPFALAGEVGTPTNYDHTRLPELLANVSYGPNVGAGRDCGYDHEAALLAENLMDHKTARQAPVLSRASSAQTDLDGWKILRIEPRYIDDIIYGNGMQRYLWIAPHWRSPGFIGDPIVTTLRIWVSGYLPTGTSMKNLDALPLNPGYVIKAPAVSNSWQVWTGDNAWRHEAPVAFPLANFNGFRRVFIIVEGYWATELRGLSACFEGERFQQ